MKRFIAALLIAASFFTFSASPVSALAQEGGISRTEGPVYDTVYGESGTSGAVGDGVYEKGTPYDEYFYVTPEQYDTLKNAIDTAYAAHTKKVSLYSYKIPYVASSPDKEDTIDLIKDLTFNNPRCFDLKTFKVRYRGSYIDSVEFTYVHSLAEYSSRLAACDEAANQMVGDLVDSGLPVELKMLLVHDRLAGWNEYDYESLETERFSYSDCQTMYGAFVLKTSVCEGYAMAYSYLLDKLGVSNYLCASDTLNHIWNIVELNFDNLGRCSFHIDVTSDDVLDTLGGVRHTYFLKSTSALGHDATDFDSSTNNTNYDSGFFWDYCSSSVQFVQGDVWFVTDGKESSRYGQRVCVIETDNNKTYGLVDLTAEEGFVWPHYQEGFVYVGNFTKLATDGVDVYFNSVDKIYKYEIKSRSYSVFCDLNQGENAIRGFETDGCLVTAAVFDRQGKLLSDKLYHVANGIITEGGHKFEWIIDSENNCGTDGVKHEECALCNKVQKENTVIPATGNHEYDSLCDEDCNVCFEHRETAHNFVWITDSENSCGAEGKKHEECSLCHATRNENTVIEATGNHSYRNECDADCNVCGYVRVVGDHIFENSCDTTCEHCTAVRTISHSFETVVTKATLTTDGSIVEKCSVCGEINNSFALKAVTDIQLSHTSLTYSGKTRTPSVTVKDADGNLLLKDTDYTVTYAAGRKNVGTYDVTVDLKGNYSGSKTLSFKINPADGTNYSYKLSTASYTYSGGVRTPTVTVVSAGGTTLKKDTDYTVTYASGRKNVGTYTVKVTLKGNFKGSKTLSFKINPADGTNYSYKLSATSYTYDGKTKTPTVTVVSKGGTTLKKDVDYTVSYASGRKSVGTYKVTIKLKGNFKGTKTLTFKINPPKTGISSLSAGTKSFTVNITKKTTQTTGYQVQYSTTGSFTSAKTSTVAKNSTVKATVKSLVAKKTYYVRVRTYKTVNGVKYYSGWSAVKSVKTK